ncbi:hypothetical protein [Streptomyces ziwulingensis]
MTAASARDKVKKAGFAPLEPYPDSAVLSWRMKCRHCGRDDKKRLSDLRKGVICNCRRRAAEAEAELHAAGYEPTVPFPGSGSGTMAVGLWPFWLSGVEQVQRLGDEASQDQHAEEDEDPPLAGLRHSAAALGQDRFVERVHSVMPLIAVNLAPKP